MATEFLYATSHLAGDFPNPGNAVGDTPGTWAGELNANSDYTSRWAIGDPVDPPTSAATQTIRVVARKGSNGGSPSVAVNLYENGSFVTELVADTTITSETGQTLSGTFTDADITNPADVEIEVVQDGATGNPSTRNSAQISHIEWEADTTELNNPIDVDALEGLVLLFSAAQIATVDVSVEPAAGPVLLFGSPPEVTEGSAPTTFEPPTGVVLLLGSPPAVTSTVSVDHQPPPAVVLLFGSPPSAAASVTVDHETPPGVVLLVGAVPSVTAVASASHQPAPGLSLLFGSPPTASAGVTVDHQPPLGMMLLAGSPPAVTSGVVASHQPPPGIVLLSGAPASVASSAVVDHDPPPGIVVLSGAPATVNSTSGLVHSPPAGLVLLLSSAQVDTVDLTVEPGAGPVLLFGAPPTVSAPTGTTVTPPPGLVFLLGSLTTSSAENITIAPNQGLSLLFGSPPTVIFDGEILDRQPTTGPVVLFGAPPSTFVVDNLVELFHEPPPGVVLLAGSPPTVTGGFAKAPPAGLVLWLGGGSHVLTEEPAEPSSPQPSSMDFRSELRFRKRPRRTRI